MSIQIAPKSVQSAEDAKKDSLHNKTAALANASTNLMCCVAMTRKSGKDTVYGGTIADANEVFASQADGGVSLVVDDILLAVLGSRHADAAGLSPEVIANATQSPMPPPRTVKVNGVDVTITTDLTVGGKDINAFKAALVTLLTQFEAGAGPVTVSTIQK